MAYVLRKSDGKMIPTSHAILEKLGSASGAIVSDALANLIIKENRLLGSVTVVDVHYKAVIDAPADSIQMTIVKYLLVVVIFILAVCVLYNALLR